MIFPTSDHCDGTHFFNPGATVIRRRVSRLAMLRWLLWRRRPERAVWPRAVPNPPQPPPPAHVAPGTAAVTFINHASFLLRLPGAVLLTDPIFSRRCSPVSWAGPARAREPGIALAALPRPDLILLSHNHYDHMDIPSLRALAERHRPRVVTLLGNAGLLARHGIAATELDWWDALELGGLRITATPARHFAARTPWDRNRALWGGFMVQDGQGRLLFAGDSGAGPHWQEIAGRLGRPHLALLPIGAYLPRRIMAPVHMDPKEAVQAHLALGAGRSVGMHFGTFQLTDEAIDAPPLALAAARAAAGLAATDFITLEPGETAICRFG
jgi:L-ascorbate metabolism protein UlaG (beta-lactamase superfamily)